MAQNVVQRLDQSTTPILHQVRDVSTILSRYDPDLYPLDTLTRQVQMRKKAVQVKIEWESVKTMNRRATVTALSALAANKTTAATLAVDSSAPFAPDDILACVASVNGGKYIDMTMPQLLVKAVNAGTSVDVLAYSADKAVDNDYIPTPAIPEGTVLVWIGTAKKEGFAKGQSKILTTDLEYNFCQILEAMVKVTRTRQATGNYTSTKDWDLARQIVLAEFRRSTEYTLWFGKRAETKDATNDLGDKRWKMGGVTSFIDNTIDYNPATLTESVLMDWLQQVFMGNNGSPTRFLFADSYLTTAIQKTQLTNKRILESITVAGISCSKIKFAQGTLVIQHARTFNEAGLQNFGVVLDMKQLSKRELRPMERIKLELWKQGTEDAEAEQYVEQASLELLNPTCHAIVRGIGANNG